MTAMKLAEALKIVQTAPPENAEQFTVYLACGFLPLHLSTFLGARLRQLMPEKRVEIETGIYGDLTGNLEQLRRSSSNAGAVVIEWSDLDSRLGLRRLGGWEASLLPDIQAGVKAQADRILGLLEESAHAVPLSVCLPTLPLPPVSYQSGEQAGLFQLQLNETLGSFALRAARIPNVKIVNAQRLDMISPPVERLDVKSELTTGFPYRTSHAAKVSELLAQLIHPRTPKKGLITDLDDTFWRGLLGEDGVGGISWDLDNRSHIHALYQQALNALAESGVLVGVASKNDHLLVLEAFGRNDLLMPRERLYPLEINWSRKSDSISRILQAWNIGSESVVFVDDSPLELAEVKSIHPDIECLLFPKSDDQAAYDFLVGLRDLFGKEAILEEDAIRLESIRRGRDFQRASGRADNGDGLSADSFLEQAEAEITLSLFPDATDSRAFELVNKTNQFNLNGRRLDKADYQSALNREGAFFLLVSYKDKYGPLGKIAVLLGEMEFPKVRVDTWVMSCRAFSRRIEHKCLEYMFELGISEIEFDFEPTPRNKPLQDFLAEFVGDALPSPCRLDREAFTNRKPPLFHKVKEISYARNAGRATEALSHYSLSRFERG